MEDNMIYLSPNDTFNFSCSSNLSCFNECCQDLVQYLTPYDILRIKNRLGISSDVFLQKYTTEHTGPETGLPVIAFKTKQTDRNKCPFISSSGCKIYEDRPSSCRMYPLARGVFRSRETEKITEQYVLLKETHCLGCSQEKIWTIGEWIIDQELAEYNKMNDMLMEIISLKNRLLPGVLDIKSRLVFHMACYDLDRFRTDIFEKDLLKDFTCDTPDILNKIKDNDTALLLLGLKWLKHILFNDRGTR